MPKRKSCGSVLRCKLPTFDSLQGFPACTHARRLAVPLRLRSKAAVTSNLHSARCQPVPNFPRLRALALFGRRPHQRAVSLAIPATKNLHNSGRSAIYYSAASDKFLRPVVLRLTISM